MRKPLLKKLSIQTYKSPLQTSASLEKELVNVFNAQAFTPYSYRILNGEKSKAYDFNLVYESMYTPKFDPVTQSAFEPRTCKNFSESETSLDAMGKILQMDIGENQDILDKISESVVSLEKEVERIKDTLVEIEQMQLAFVRKRQRKVTK